ncbi:MAG: rhomboid family intramembrane serine protease [Candidatus Muiribacteriota bacterium]
MNTKNENRYLNCPRCSTSILESIRVGNINVDLCPSCKGMWLDDGELEVMLGNNWSYRNIIDNLFPIKDGPECPVCDIPMVTQEYKKNAYSVYIDHCPYCKGFWLDGGELQKLKKLSQAFITRKRDNLRTSRMITGSNPVFSPEVKQIINHYSKLDYDTISDNYNLSAAVYLFCLLSQTPYEIYNPRKFFPGILFGLVFINFFIYFYIITLDFYSVRVLLSDFALVPVELFSRFNITSLITHSFIHGNFAHVLVNMYFIWIFGDNLYDLFIGHGKTKGIFMFVAFYAVLAALAGLTHVLIVIFSSEMRMIPLIGASGIASGFLASYWKKFPKSRFYQVIIVFPFKISVRTYMIIWLITNIYLGLRYGVHSQVSWQAHLGGFLFGYLLIDRFLPEKFNKL